MAVEMNVGADKKIVHDLNRLEKQYKELFRKCIKVRAISSFLLLRETDRFL